MKPLAEAMTRHRDQQLMTVIYKGIEWGLWPWKPGTIEAWTDQEFSRFGPTLTFKVDLLPDLPFIAYPDVMRYDPETAVAKMANDAFQFYRNRPALPVDDHIMLGED